MPVVSPIQTAFIGGKWSGAARGRVDLPNYKFALEECRNFDISSRGSLLLRGGTTKVLAAASENVRLFELKTRWGGAYIVEMTPLEMRIRDAVTGALQLNAPDIMVSGQFDSVLTNWLEGPYSGSSGPYLLAPGNYGAVMYRDINQPAYVRTKNPIAVVAGTNYRLSFEFAHRFGTDSGNVRVKIGTSAHGSEIAQVDVAVLGAAVINFNSGAATAIHFKFEREGSLTYSTIDQSNGVVIDNVQLRDSGAGASVIVTPWDEQHLADLAVEIEPAADKAYFAHANVAPYRLVRNADTTWTLALLSSIAGALLPVEWTGTNWPSRLCMAGGRLYAAATPAEGHRVWGSQVGAPHNFALGTGLDKEGLDFKLATRGSVQWMKEGRDLMVGTELGEYAILASAGVITPSDVHVRAQSAFGGAAIPAATVGARVIYASQDGRRVHAALYDQNSDGWNSEDLTFLSELEAFAVMMQSVRAPHGSIIVLLSDGTMAVCTYNAAKDIAAWWDLDVGGEVVSIATSESAAGAALWLAVRRANGTYIERMEWSSVSVYLDASISTVLTAGQTVVAGLNHLEGETVRVLVNGALDGDYLVTGGEITLAEAAVGGETAVIGLPYSALAKTLPIEGGNPDGTAQGMKVHYADIMARLNNSARPKINGKRAGGGRPFSTPANTAEALVTADVKVKDIGVDEGGQITIEQDLPFRTEICAVYGRASMSKL